MLKIANTNNVDLMDQIPVAATTDLQYLICDNSNSSSPGYLVYLFSLLGYLVYLFSLLGYLAYLFSFQSGKVLHKGDTFSKPIRFRLGNVRLIVIVTDYCFCIVSFYI